MSALREGFTTGSCAAACALASCLWRRDGACPLHVELTTPDGRTYAPEILPKEAFACAVQKDSGDDPDITNGCEVWVRAEVMDEDGPVCFHAGADVVALVFGSQKEAALARLCPEMPAVQISNFVGAALDTAAELGFGRVLLAGEPGKLVKVAGGCMQTHSRYGDGRRETLTAHLARMCAPLSLLEAVWASATLDGVIAEIGVAGYARVWERLCREASAYGMARVRGALPVDTMMLDAKGRVLGTYRVPDGEEERP